ncbi:hypothetical protein JW992_10840 [candidate division KSB1 bacterium]|nr:hypothetical protein [candidate division KSB1 bacterium]
MAQRLTQKDWLRLIPAVFPPIDKDPALAVLLDVPHDAEEDTDAWKARRTLVAEWVKQLKKMASSLHLSKVELIAYASVGSNNADLPETAYSVDSQIISSLYASDFGRSGVPVHFSDVFSRFALFLAPTQFSATAPLKNAARTFGFRAATMPGFASSMIPALRIDYGRVNERVEQIKQLLDQAECAWVHFSVDEQMRYEMQFDLRNRTAHVSSGRFPERGTAGNLPSGEAYIVPYEGEGEDESRTTGILPVQFGAQVVFYRIEKNRARGAQGEGTRALTEDQLLRREPAYGNIAELGFGVLADFGIEPIGEVLLDEKLGFHVAFGRSDHFGGFVGIGQFSSPQAVVHIDRIYIPALQPRVVVESIDLVCENKDPVRLIEKGNYTIF